jgi:hypothetical protein
MVGAADADRARTSFVRMPADARILEMATGPVRASVDPTIWDAEVARGRALLLEEAIGEAVALLAR